MPEPAHRFTFEIIEIVIKQRTMKPSAPSKYVWIFGLILGILGIAAHFISLDILSEYNYPLLLAGFILLASGTTFREF